MKPADEIAFVDFAQGARPRLRRTAYLLCGDWDLASDHVQEGLIRVYVNWPRMRRTGGEHAYARRAVLSAFLDSTRKRSSKEYATEADATLSSGEDVAESVTARRALMTALEQLPPRQRACVVLRYFEDLDVAATAAALGCTQGTVKSQTSRALDSLRSMFDESPTGELVVINEGELVMVNDLRSLLHETSDNAPHDHYDVASTIRLGNSRLRRRRANVAGASALVASAVIGSALWLGGNPGDRTPPDGPSTEPVGAVLDLQDATASDLEPILRYEAKVLSPLNGSRYVDGVTGDGQAIVHNSSSDLPRTTMMLVDLATGAEEPLPDLPGYYNPWLLEATDERIVYNTDETTTDSQTGDRIQEVGALVLDRARETWRKMRWPDLPQGMVVGREVGPDGRLYVAINPDISMDTMDTDGATADLWSVSLTDPADVRDEGLIVGGFTIDGNHLVWSERANGVSNQLTVRDLQTGEETSFDPQSGRHCTQTYLGLDSDRIVMSQSCGTEGGVTDDRVQVVTMTGEPVVTFRDDSIWGHVDEGGHLLIEATGPGDEGVYSYDLTSGDFVRLSTSTTPYVPPARVADGYLLWAEGYRGEKGFAQTIAEAP